MASQLPRSQAPLPSALDPRHILDMNYAFASTAILVAAVRLRIFTLLARGHSRRQSLRHSLTQLQIL
ncbi:MAG TPA: hypothetical protein VEL31_06490 [Ktedonobacteraceae bacterium]|nr:hypothetical protein [Ktedonobacteraceae bacterium]